MYGTDYDYANNRLAETIVRHGREPVYVHHIDHIGMAQISYLRSMEDHTRVHLDKLDLRPVPLGYCNFNKHASYASRIPMRRDWRQGLRRGNFVTLSGVDANRLPYEALRMTIIGEFPALPKCLEHVKKAVASSSWHREWAVRNDGAVLYKGYEEPVGEVKEGSIILLPRKIHLKEALAESL